MICRRQFIQSAGCLGISVALLGLSSADAAGLSVSFIDGTQSGDEKRYAIPAADSVNIDRGAQLIVVRFSGHVYVFALACPHRNYAVQWVDGDHRFHCTKHDSVYETDGLHVAGRASVPA